METITFSECESVFETDKIVTVQPDDVRVDVESLLKHRSKSYNDLPAIEYADTAPMYDIRKSVSMVSLRTPVLVSYENVEPPETTSRKSKHPRKHAHAQSFSDLRSLRDNQPCVKSQLRRQPSLDALIAQAQQRTLEQKRKKLSVNTLDFRVCKLRILATLEIVERVVSSPYISEDFKLDMLEKFDELFTTYLFERIKFNKIDRSAVPNSGEIRELAITGDYAYINF